MKKEIEARIKELGGNVFAIRIRALPNSAHSADLLTIEKCFESYGDHGTCVAFGPNGVSVIIWIGEAKELIALGAYESKEEYPNPNYQDEDD